MCAAFISHQLANIAYLRKFPTEAELRSVYQNLMDKPINESELRAWLALRWIDQTRFHAAVDFALKNELLRTTHLFLAR